MMQVIEANWLAVALALVIGLLVAWWLFGRSGGATRERYRSADVLDEGAAPAQRNAALINAPSATTAALAATGPDIVGGVGELAALAAAEEVAAATPVAASAAPVAGGDNLARIKGVGPKLVALLQGLGVTTYAEIAAWTDADIDRIDAQLGAFAGRIRRDNLVDQCKLLAAADTAAYEAKFGKL